MRLYPLISFVLLAFLSCESDNGSQTVPEEVFLVVTSYTPLSGYVGDEITLTAQNIDILKPYVIKVDELVAGNISITETTLKASIPEGATLGNISVEYDNIVLTVGQIEVKEPLLVTSYAPLSGYVGDEITLQGENIDTTTIYTIKIGGLAAGSLLVTESSLRARIPTYGVTGDITVEYDDRTLSVGALEVKQSTDEFYICSFLGTYDCSPSPHLNKIDFASGEIIGDVGPLFGNCNEFSNNILSNPRNNTLVNAYSYGGGQNYGSSHVVVRNIDTGVSFGLLTSSYELGFPGNVFRSIGSVGETELYYVHYTVDGMGVETQQLIAQDLVTHNTTSLFEFPGPRNDSWYSWGRSCFVPSTNSYIGFTEDGPTQPVFFKIDISSQTLTTTTTPLADEIREVLITSEDIIYGLRYVRPTYEIVQLDPNTGEILLVIDTINDRVKNLNFSESSNRFFLSHFDPVNNQWNSIYTYSLDSGTSSILTLINDQTFFGLVLNY